MLEGLKVYIRWAHICIVGRDVCISNTPSIFSLMDLDFRGHTRYRGGEVIGQEMQLPLFTPGILEHLTSAWTFHFPTQMIDYLKRTQGWTKMMHTRILGIVDYQHIDCGCINNLLNIFEFQSHTLSPQRRVEKSVLFQHLSFDGWMFLSPLKLETCCSAQSV